MFLTDNVAPALSDGNGAKRTVLGDCITPPPFRWIK